MQVATPSTESGGVLAETVDADSIYAASTSRELRVYGYESVGRGAAKAPVLSATRTVSFATVGPASSVEHTGAVGNFLLRQLLAWFASKMTPAAA